MDEMILMLSAIAVRANVSVKSIPGDRVKRLATRRALNRASVPSYFALMLNTHLFLTVLRPGEEPQATRCYFLSRRSSASSPPLSASFIDSDDPLNPVLRKRSLSELYERVEPRVTLNSISCVAGEKLTKMKNKTHVHLPELEVCAIIFVDWALKKSPLTSAAEKVIWDKKDKQAIVPILATIDSIHKAEVINCTTLHAMWTQLQAYHDQHSDECINALQEKYYGSKLLAGESIAIFISSLQKLAKQLTDLGHPISDQQLIRKIKCAPLRFLILSSSG